MKNRVKNMFRKHLEFRNKLLNEIKWWAAAAAVLPIVGLAVLFYVWVYGTDRMFNVVMVIGSSTMFFIAVTWWWWALYSIRTLISQWDETRDNVKDVVIEVKAIRDLVKDIIKLHSDK